MNNIISRLFKDYRSIVLVAMDKEQSTIIQKEVFKHSGMWGDGTTEVFHDKSKYTSHTSIELSYDADKTILMYFADPTKINDHTKLMSAEQVINVFQQTIKIDNDGNLVN